MAAIKGVVANGKTITLERLEDGAAVSQGTFITMCKDGVKAKLLERMKDECAGWLPDNAMSDMMPMFIGTLDQNKIMWLLRQDECILIEADGVVTIADAPPSPFLRHSGYIAGGGDIETATMTLGDAKRRALELPGCKGFCFQHHNCNDPHTAALLVYFKDKFDMNDSADWTSYSLNHGFASLMVNGEIITLDQLRNGSIEVEQGTFIVGTKDKPTVLQKMKNELGWEPSNAMSDAMPLFIGSMDQNNIMWLLSQPNVEYVEADGVISISRK